MANSIINDVASYLNFDNSIMSLDDWGMAALGVTLALVDSVVPSLFGQPRGAVRSLVLFLTGNSMAQLNNDYYFVSARMQAAYMVYITGTVAAAGSTVAAAATFATAGVTVKAGIYTFAGSGAAAWPVSLGFGVASASNLVASGVLFVAGVALGAATADAWNVMHESQRFLMAATTAQLGRIARQFPVFKCDTAATAMSMFLATTKKPYYFAEIQFGPITVADRLNRIVVRTIRGGVFPPYTEISTNGYHVGILFNGRVHCNVHPDGLLMFTWFNDFIGPGTPVHTIRTAPWGAAKMLLELF
jgi:hypothetical protein